jgi:hypothetical protein
MILTNENVGIHVTVKFITVIYRAPFGQGTIERGKMIHCPLGKISVLFSHKNPIGRLLESPYILDERTRLHHASIVRMSTSYEGNLFVDDKVCMMGLGSFLMVGLTPTYALDGDIARYEEDR